MPDAMQPVTVAMMPARPSFGLRAWIARKR